MRRLFLLLPLAFLLLPPLPAADDPPGDKILALFVDEFVSLTPGKGKFPATFVLGSAEAGAPASEKPTVTVRFARPFAMAKYEVTQELWSLVMGTNPSKWKGRRNSAEKMDWTEANTFCTRVTALLHKKKLLDPSETIRLPSEAEWEYACRAGTTTRYSFGDDVKDLGPHAWYRANSEGHDPPVGKKKPNPWGLYDMHGYIWEWCADSWSPDHKGAATDGSPRLNRDEKHRVIRGGSWADPADSARSAYRGKALLTTKNDRIGFRCVRVGAAITKKEDGK